MTRYTVVGAINLLLGILELAISVIALVIFIPELAESFKDIGVTTPPSFLPIYLSFGLVIIVGIANLFVGSKLLSKGQQQKSRYFKYGIILAATTFILVITYYVGLILTFPVMGFL